MYSYNAIIYNNNEIKFQQINIEPQMGRVSYWRQLLTIKST